MNRGGVLLLVPGVAESETGVDVVTRCSQQFVHPSIHVLKRAHTATAAAAVVLITIQIELHKLTIYLTITRYTF